MNIQKGELGVKEIGHKILACLGGFSGNSRVFGKQDGMGDEEGIQLEIYQEYPIDKLFRRDKLKMGVR
jgi:hypothetical protein